MFFEVEAFQDGFTQLNGPTIFEQCHVCAVEKDFFHKVKDDDVMERFQAMKKKRTNLLCFVLLYLFIFVFLILYNCTVKNFFGIPLI
ncbi:hypothetical protein HanRHA438_Chr04g0192071 [Helianthus annuus]|nr:hypothetical protein HanRHA438_Chr04g0192071 [Helianthus annuus]